MKDLGKKGEDLAVALCKEIGLNIIEQNFRTPFGEIDIIARDGNIIVFIEVRLFLGLGRQRRRAGRAHAATAAHVGTVAPTDVV